MPAALTDGAVVPAGMWAAWPGSTAAPVTAQAADASGGGPSRPAASTSSTGTASRRSRTTGRAEVRRGSGGGAGDRDGDTEGRALTAVLGRRDHVERTRDGHRGGRGVRRQGHGWGERNRRGRGGQHVAGGAGPAAHRARRHRADGGR